MPSSDFPPRLRAALEKLEQRATAVAGEKPDEQQHFHVIEDTEADSWQERLLNGYVDDGDIPGAKQFCAAMQMAVVLTMAANPTIAGGELATRFAVAQVFLAGVLYERERAAEVDREGEQLRANREQYMREQESGNAPS